MVRSLTPKPIESIYVAESDAGTFVVKDYRHPEVEEVVTWDLGANRWVCTCSPDGTTRTDCCDHIVRVGTKLPLDTALALAARVCARRQKPNPSPGRPRKSA